MHLKSSRSTRTLPPIPAHLADMVKQGFYLFPVYEPLSENECSCPRSTSCEDIGKHPRITDWPAYASKMPNRISAWLRKWPETNWGIACGPSGLVVLDEDAPGEFEKLCANLGFPFEEPPTLTVKTHKGHHFYFARDHATAPIGNPNVFKEFGFLIDVRGNGGFVVAPGSRHRSGDEYTVVAP